MYKLGGKFNYLFLYVQLEFHIHHAKEPARVSRIVSVLDPKTGKVTKMSPRCLTAKQSAVIEVNKVINNATYTYLSSSIMPGTLENFWNHFCCL